MKRIKEINVMYLGGRPKFPLKEGLLRQPDPGATRTRRPSHRLSWIDSEDGEDDELVVQELDEEEV